MALSGFNPEEVNTSINSVKSAYESLTNAIIGRMQNEFVNGMADKWACNNAQSFFGDTFKPVVDSLITESNNVFESVVNSMNEAAQAWAQETNSSYTPTQFSANGQRIDVNGILENINGVRGIDLAEADVVAGKLPSIASDASSALEAAKSAVLNCGFIGGDQAGNLQNSLGQIKTNIEKATNDITEQVKAAINTTVQNYANTEGKISAAFAGNN